MKCFWLIIFLTLATVPLFAERVPENNEVYVSAGVNVPMHKDIENDVIVGIHYGHYYNTGIGFRTGVQYSPSVADVSNYVGVPLAFTFRIGSKSTQKRLESAAAGAFESAVNSERDALKSGFAGFFMNVFDRIEFSAGLTPGYVAGENSVPGESVTVVGGNLYKEKSWTEKPYSFALSLDAGFNINCRIWRFDIKLMPAFHYNLTDNFRYHIDYQVDGQVPTHEVKPVKWFFTFSGALAFRF